MVYLLSDEVARERAMEDTQRVAKQNMQTEIAQLDQISDFIMCRRKLVMCQGYLSDFALAPRKLTKLTSDCVEASKATELV